MGNQLNYKKEVRAFYEPEDLQGDEIDLIALWRILEKRKHIILWTTSIVAVSGFIFSLLQTPVYEVKSNLKIGHIGQTLIVEPEVLQRTLKIIFNVDLDGVGLKGERAFPLVSHVSKDKNAVNFMVIKTEAFSNDEALKKNEEVVKYVQALSQDRIDQYVLENRSQIRNLQRQIAHIATIEMKDIDEQIKLLKTQNLVRIDEEIERLKTQDIVKIDKNLEKLRTQDMVRIDEEIHRLKTQDMVKINEKIEFFQNVELVSLQTKIDFQIEKLSEYSQSVMQIKELNEADNISSMISSVQMLNYQNLILNAQKDIEDLKLRKNVILNETMPDLKRQRENIIHVAIKDLETKKRNILDVDIKNLLMQRENILTVTIANLQREKNTIQSETIRKLEDQRNIVLTAKAAKLKEEIELLEMNISKENLQNTEVVGDYLVYKDPIKPRKKIIIVAALLLGLILSIFFVFFREFIDRQKLQGA